jgi:RNA polymerase sigma-70 factor (ECF subfamily)
MKDSDRQSGFPTTHWSCVAHAVDPASSESRAALAELFRVYWFPIYAFVRRKGHDPDQALDLTQEYCTRLLETDVLSRADSTKGRFRTFLRTDCGYFLSHQHERRQALKRGAGRTYLSIDARDAEGRYLREPVDMTSPERLFDRTWAMNLLEDVLKRLAEENTDAGRADQFEILQGSIGRQTDQASYAELSAQLGMSVAAVQKAVQRLRQRYRAILRERIAATLVDFDDAVIDEEIRQLFAVLAE